MKINFEVTWQQIVGGFVWGLGPCVGLAIVAPSLTPFAWKWWFAAFAISFFGGAGDWVRTIKQ